MIAPIRDFELVAATKLMQPDECRRNECVGRIREVARFCPTNESAVAGRVEPTRKLSLWRRRRSRHSALMTVLWLLTFRVFTRGGASTRSATAKPVATTTAISTESITITTTVSASIAVATAVWARAPVESIVALRATATIWTIGALRPVTAFDALTRIAACASGITARWALIDLIGTSFPFDPIGSIDGAIEIASGALAFDTFGSFPARPSAGRTATPAASATSGVPLTVIRFARRSVVHSVDDGADIRNRPTRW
jgi:hypothetical protein